MAGSTIGTAYRVTTWGESHGDAIGAVIDGCPAGVPLSEDDIQEYLDRRKPGQSKYTTKRAESDTCRILSGVFMGVTTGTPISVMIENTDQRSHDYSQIESTYRPGHADYTYDKKYGFRDYRGGGRSSGRETIGRVIGGAVAAKVLAQLGIEISAYTQSIGPVSAQTFNPEVCKENPLYMPDAQAAKQAAAYVDELMMAKDSAGGIVGCMVIGTPAGIGEPVYDKLDAELAKAVMSIGAVKGVEIGAGFAVSQMTGSQDNDGFTSEDKDGVKKIVKTSNNAGGIMGGISDGSSIMISAAIKPTPSISSPQHTVDSDGADMIIEIAGRHDPIIVPRAVVVVESMVAITILDMMIRGMGSKVENLKKVYGGEA